MLRYVLRPVVIVSIMCSYRALDVVFASENTTYENSSVWTNAKTYFTNSLSPLTSLGPAHQSQKVGSTRKHCHLDGDGAWLRLDPPGNIMA